MFKEATDFVVGTGWDLVKGWGKWAFDNGIYNTEKPPTSWENIFNIGFGVAAVGAGVFTGGTATATMFGARAAAMGTAKVGMKVAGKEVAEQAAKEGAEQASRSWVGGAVSDTLSWGGKKFKNLFTKADATKEGAHYQAKLNAMANGRDAAAVPDAARKIAPGKAFVSVSGLAAIKGEAAEGFAQVMGGDTQLTGSDGPGRQNPAPGRDQSGILGTTMNVFNKASGFLVDKLGLDPDIAKLVVGFGAFMAMSMGLGSLFNMTPMAKMPVLGGLGSLGTTLAAGVLAYELVAKSAQSPNAPQVNNNRAMPAFTGPALVPSGLN